MTGIAELRTVALDCPDPRALAEFYAGVTGWSVTYQDEEWVTLEGPGRVRLGFQRATDYRPPAWPDPNHPQQFHLDFHLGGESELPDAEKQVLALGAKRLEHHPGQEEGANWVVYADPVGHPFCLCW